MSPADLAIISALVFAWGTLSARLERFDVTAPIVFTTAGLVLTHGPLRALGVTPSRELVRVLAEATLAVVLFTDASRIGIANVRADAGLYARVLGVGLPLTAGLGTAFALVLVSGNIWLALLTGAALAPTDAALGAGLMVNPAVPARIRRLINVESGLNDGIAAPLVSVAIAGAAATGEVSGAGPAGAATEVATGLAAGLVVGGAGGALVRVASRRGWVAGGFAGSAVLGLAVCAYTAALVVHGNGFIASFVGGLAFAAAGRRRATQVIPFVEEAGTAVSLLVWLMFGVLAAGLALEGLTWQIALYAVLSLTLIRMVPAAAALAGAGLGWAGVAFVGWFGPRGLASVVFALLALEELPWPSARGAVTAVSFTVLLSVLAHGMSAHPLAARWGPRMERGPAAEAAGVPERRLIRRSPL